MKLVAITRKIIPTYTKIMLLPFPDQFGPETLPLFAEVILGRSATQKTVQRGPSNKTMAD